MKSKFNHIIVALTFMALCTLHSALSTAEAQGTAFTYEGQLNSSGSPANGNYDFTFALFDNSSTNTGQVGNTLTNLNVGVTNGLFTVTLDFGDVFTGNATWLAIGVRTNSGANFTGLSPLQELMPVPYAMYAPNAGFAACANSVAATNITGTIPLAQLPAAIITNDSSSLTLGSANEIAPLTVPPTVPSSAIGSVGTGTYPYSVAVAGRYAYVVNNGASTLQIIDVSTPSAPISVGSVSTGTSVSVAVAGRYAYVAEGNGLQIIDVSNPSAPVVIGSAGSGASGYAQSIAVAGRYAYVLFSTGTNFGTLQVFDVSAPSEPLSVGMMNMGNNPTCLAVAGRYAYVSSAIGSANGALQILDVGNPSAPVSVGVAYTGGIAISVAVAGRYAYMGSIPSPQGFGGAESLSIIDVSNPSVPGLVGSVGTGSDPISVAVAGRYAYVVNNGSSTLQVFDVSKPSAPVSVASVGTGSDPFCVAVSGRYAYVVNWGPGTLQIFDLGGAYIQQLEAGAMETGTLQTRDTVTVGNNLNVRGGLSASGSALINGGLGVNGSVGIGISTPAYTLQVNGTVAGVGNYVNASDARYKTNIARLTHALDKIMALRGVEYDWRSNAFPQMKFENGTQFGFVAQEIKEVLPEVVSQDAQGYYSIAYSKVIPVLVEAIKDQQKEMNEKNADIEALKQNVAELKKLVQTLAEKK
jgi:hypothetical protein